jgi:hypothetical protein
MWGEVAEEDPYSVGVTVNDDGTGSIWIEPTYGGEFTITLSLLLGELLYQLRAALDSCIYAARIRETGKTPPPDEDRLEFPICKKRADFKTFNRAPLAQKRRDIIEAIQPYNVPNLAPEDLVHDFNRTFGILSEWARIDRHRRLHVLGSWASNASPMIRLPKGTVLVDMHVAGAGFLEGKNEIATFHLSGYRPGMTVHANPDVLIDVAVNEIPPPCADNDTLGNRLHAMTKAVEFVVCSIEASF